jgi:hypothetical protein
MEMPTDVERAAEGLGAAWSSRDVEKIASLFTLDCVYEDVCNGPVYRGQEQLKAMGSAILDAIPELRLELKSLFAAGEWPAAEWIETGTQNGRRFSLAGASIVELHQGKIKREAIYAHFDGATWFDA